MPSQARMKRPVAVMEVESCGDSSTYRCGGSSGWGVAGDAALPSLIPVELQRVNHAASTNGGILSGVAYGAEFVGI